ncbi:MAG: bifunctional chorismate mutase/prephenate dehydrogenase [Myxococcota bacterium]
MNHPKEPIRSLPVLRATLDTIDRDVLRLFSRRMAIVAEVAAYKRQQGLRIRDLDRERQMLGDRCLQAEDLGLPAGVIESIYRLVLLASRDHQASLRVEVPPEVEPRSIAIIGGRGGMGQLFARMFSELGHQVWIADRNTELTPEKAASLADVVLISVPIQATEEVIERIGPRVRPESLLCDLTSVKQGPMEAMLASCRGSVVGTHPMFGPGVHVVPGHRVVICRGRGDEWYRWLAQMFRARGLMVVESNARQHDRIMALVQVLNHFQTQVMGLALSRSGVAIEESLAFTSPAYLLESYVTARHFAQSPDLYGPIEMLNPRTSEVTESFCKAAQEVALILESKDQPGFERMFQEVRDFFGDFTEQALVQSRFLVDRLIELTAGMPHSEGSSSTDEILDSSKTP